MNVLDRAGVRARVSEEREARVALEKSWTTWLNQVHLGFIALAIALAIIATAVGILLPVYGVGLVITLATAYYLHRLMLRLDRN